MIPLSTLLAEIWLADSSFRIEEGAYHGIVRMINNPRDETEQICVESDSLGRTIEIVWSLFYNKGVKED